MPAALLLIAGTAIAAPTVTWGNIPLSFEPNRGQARAEVQYLARGSSYTLYLSRAETVLAGRGYSPLRTKLPAQIFLPILLDKPRKNPRVITSSETIRVSGEHRSRITRGSGTSTFIQESTSPTTGRTGTWNMTGSSRRARIQRESARSSKARIACGSIGRAIL